MKEKDLNECASVSGPSNQESTSSSSPNSSNIKTAHPKAHLKQSAQDLSLPTFIKVEKVTRYVGADGELFETHEEAINSIRRFEAWADLKSFVNATSWGFQDADLVEYIIEHSKTLATLLNAVNEAYKVKGE